MTTLFVIARAQPEAIQEVREPDVGTRAGAVNFLDRHGPSGLAMTVDMVRDSR
jgi:hypothetical protein